MPERVGILEKSVEGLEQRESVLFRKINGVSEKVDDLKDRLWKWTIIVSIMAGASGAGGSFVLKAAGW